MAMNAKEIREQLGKYVAGDVQPEEFRDWFALVLRDVHQSDDAEAETLVNAIEWEFLDRERGLLTDATLRDQLERLACTASEGPLVSTVLVNRVFVLGGATVSSPMAPNVKWSVAGQWIFGEPADKESSVVFV